MTSMTQPVDVNAAFAAERADQMQAAQDRQARTEADITAGKLIPTGRPGRYTVNDPGSWDNGEVLTLNQGRLIPQHQLDVTTGEAALYTAVPAWHGLGAVIPGGTSDIEEVLRLGRIDFQVDKQPVRYVDPTSGDDKILPEHYVTVRQDTGAGLGVVGSRYQVFQQREVFEFLQELVDDFDVTWESAGALRGGRRVFISLRLPDTVTIDAGGIKDEIIPFVMAVNSHDGFSRAEVVVTPWRPVCGNTERFALRDASARWGVRHTRNGLQRAEEARRTLGLSLKYFEQFRAEEEALARYELEMAEWQKVQDVLWPKPEEGASKNAQTIHSNRAAVLDGLYRANAEKLGRTAYAAERTITEWADWKTTVRPSGVLKGNRLDARITSAIEGDRDDLKSKAHRQLLTLTNR